jgi:hypothetical protein
MVTLTLDPKEPRYAARLADYARAGGSGTSAPSVVHARESWNRLRLSLSREFGALAYFKGMELTKAGTAHLHVLVRVSSVSDFWRLRALTPGLAVRAGFGKVVQSDLARRSGDVARYVTKADGGRGMNVAAYATKGIDGRFPRYARRASWAKEWAPGWVRPTPLAGFSWRVAPLSVSRAVAALIASDFVIAEPFRFRVGGRSAHASG